MGKHSGGPKHLDLLALAAVVVAVIILAWVYIA